MIITSEQIAGVVAALDYVPVNVPTQSRHEVAIAFLLALETGMRAGEVMGLERKRLHLANHQERQETRRGPVCARC